MRLIEYGLKALSLQNATCSPVSTKSTLSLSVSRPAPLSKLQYPPLQTFMGIELLRDPAADSPIINSKRKRKRKRKRKQRAQKKAMEENTSIVSNSIDEILEVPKRRDCTLDNCCTGKNHADMGISGQTSAECPTMVVGTTENLSEVSEMSSIRKKKNGRVRNKKKAKPRHEDQALSTNLAKMDTDLDPTKNLVEGNMNEEQENRQKNINEGESKDEAQSIGNAEGMSNLPLSEEDHGRVVVEKLTTNKFTVQDCKDAVEVSCGGVSSKSLEETPGDTLRPVEVETKPFPCGSQLSSNPNHMDVKTLKFHVGINEVSKGIIVSKGKFPAEGGNVQSSCEFELKTHAPSHDLIDLGQCPRMSQLYSTNRKLLVLDVNGLLANIFFPAPKDRQGDTHILGRAVFKRPFCDDFLKFCFQNFDVGIWSSRSKKLIDRVVEYLLGDLQDKLLFCWDMFHSTQTGFKTLENCHKPLVCKELRKIWESDGPNLRWRKGQYNQSNSLLVDDSPYKALLNPLYTAIFPNSYDYEDSSDNSLGPGGALRVYLEELLASENVQEYVEQHPFGQSAINETSLSWEFYSRVLQTVLIQPENDVPASLPTLSFPEAAQNVEGGDAQIMELHSSII